MPKSSVDSTLATARQLFTIRQLENRIKELEVEVYSPYTFLVGSLASILLMYQYTKVISAGSASFYEISHERKSALELLAQKVEQSKQYSESSQQVSLMKEIALGWMVEKSKSVLQTFLGYTAQDFIRDYPDLSSMLEVGGVYPSSGLSDLHAQMYEYNIPAAIKRLMMKYSKLNPADWPKQKYATLTDDFAVFSKYMLNAMNESAGFTQDLNLTYHGIMVALNSALSFSIYGILNYTFSKVKHDGFDKKHKLRHNLDHLSQQDASSYQHELVAVKNRLKNKVERNHRVLNAVSSVCALYCLWLWSSDQTRSFNATMIVLSSLLQAVLGLSRETQRRFEKRGLDKLLADKQAILKNFLLPILGSEVDVALFKGEARSDSYFVVTISDKANLIITKSLMHFIDKHLLDQCGIISHSNNEIFIQAKTNLKLLSKNQALQAWAANIKKQADLLAELDTLMNEIVNLASGESISHLEFNDQDLPQKTHEGYLPDNTSNKALFESTKDILIDPLLEQNGKIYFRLGFHRASSLAASRAPLTQIRDTLREQLRARQRPASYSQADTGTTRAKKRSSANKSSHTPALLPLSQPHPIPAISQNRHIIWQSGRYDQGQKGNIAPLNSPYHPPNRIFLKWNVAETAFRSTEEHDHFHDLSLKAPHLVPPVGHQGAVYTSEDILDENGKQITSPLKMKSKHGLFGAARVYATREEVAETGEKLYVLSVARLKHK